MNWNRAAIAALCALPVIGLLTYSMRRDPHDIPSPLPGQRAPQFSLVVFAPGELPLGRPMGDTVRLADLRGDVVVLNFWASWCLPCREEHATFKQAARQYQGKPVHFIGSLYQDTPEAGREWIARMGGQVYPSLLDPQTRTAIDYGVYGVPETFFIGRDGRVARKITGPPPASVVTQIVDSLLGAPAAKGSP